MQKKERTAPVHSSLLLLTNGFYHNYTANASFLFTNSLYFVGFCGIFRPFWTNPAKVLQQSEYKKGAVSPPPFVK